jgi:hypothetical protein
MPKEKSLSTENIEKVFFRQKKPKRTYCQNPFSETLKKILDQA